MYKEVYCLLAEKADLTSFPSFLGLGYSHVKRRFEVQEEKVRGYESILWFLMCSQFPHTDTTHGYGTVITSHRVPAKDCGLEENRYDLGRTLSLLCWLGLLRLQQLSNSQPMFHWYIIYSWSVIRMWNKIIIIKSLNIMHYSQIGLKHHNGHVMMLSLNIWKYWLQSTKIPRFAYQNAITVCL